MKILIVAPSWIGDAVMAQPLYRYLKERHSLAKVEVLAPAGSSAILSRMPEVDNIITHPFLHKMLKLRQRWQLGRQLRKNSYQQAIILPNSFKSALIPWFAQIPLRTGYKGEQRYGLLNDLHYLPSVASPRMVDRFVALAMPQSIMRSRLEEAPQFFYPQLTTCLNQKSATLAKFGLNTAQPIAIFCPGAEYGPAKRWPIRHFMTLSQALQKKGYQVWLMGGPKEAMLTQQLSKKDCLTAIAHNLCGKTTLEEAIDLMSVAQVVVSNDTGLMHIAAALNRPLVALYGSSSPAFTPPLSDVARPLSLNLACSPCFKRHCPLKHFDCMQHLYPETVLAAIEAVLH